MNIKGKWSLITGASSGIGEQFARQLAKEGSHLVLVARSKRKLDTLAAELTRSYGIQCQVIPQDLSIEGAAGELYQKCQQLNLNIDLWLTMQVLPPMVCSSKSPANASMKK